MGAIELTAREAVTLLSLCGMVRVIRERHPLKLWGPGIDEERLDALERKAKAAIAVDELERAIEESGEEWDAKLSDAAMHGIASAWEAES